MVMLWNSIYFCCFKEADNLDLVKTEIKVGQGKQKMQHKNHMKMEKRWNDCQSCETLCVLKIGTKQL